MTHPQQAPTPTAGTGDNSATRDGRGGYLYPKVIRFLATRPGELLKVGEITRAIGAPSTGAVFEVLKKMAAAGHATHLRDPHRFQITTGRHRRRRPPRPATAPHRLRDAAAPGPA